MILTGDLILESAKRGISFPSNNANNISDDDILAFAYEEIVSKIMPMMTSLRQEFLIAPPYTIDIVSGTQRYRIPQRALGRTLRDVYLVDGSDNSRPLTMIKPEDKGLYMFQASRTGPTEAFYVENDYLVLLPIPSDSDSSLDITYPLRPSKITVVDEAGIIQSATPSTGIIVLETALSSITTSTACDIVSATSGNIIRTISITPTNVSGTTITFAVDAFDDSVAVGDYLCLAEETPVAQIPEEAHVVLARATQNRILESIDDYDGLKVGVEILQGKDGKGGLMGDLRELLTPRVEGRPARAKGDANRYFLNGDRRRFTPRVRV